ncbi:hypothetical protein CRE_28863 [Caenorhabditis remanei]|uniref:Uncharacterized protein n=1 Tax=Caenorhabditis remanei TaxID=31234 RepID=E3MXJ0_CAERE|nr:hypothetical protein CRE_28863 [Caenorhabditis remanei]
MKFLIAVLLAFCLLQAITADIFCNDFGNCIGDGAPFGDTRCGNCHSCVYKDCCNVKYTNPISTCYIPGWRSDEYKYFHENILMSKLPVA